MKSHGDSFFFPPSPCGGRGGASGTGSPHRARLAISDVISLPPQPPPPTPQKNQPPLHKSPGCGAARGQRRSPPAPTGLAGRTAPPEPPAPGPAPAPAPARTSPPSKVPRLPPRKLPGGPGAAAVAAGPPDPWGRPRRPRKRDGAGGSGRGAAAGELLPAGAPGLAPRPAQASGAGRPPPGPAPTSASVVAAAGGRATGPGPGRGPGAFRAAPRMWLSPRLLAADLPPANGALPTGHLRPSPGGGGGGGTLPGWRGR